MIDQKMLSALSCPQCKAAELSANLTAGDAARFMAGKLRCADCDAEYEIRDGVPDLIPRKHLSSPRWQLWMDHLAGLEARRKCRKERPNSFATKATNESSRLQKAFAEFTGIQTGAVLDVGCGPGNFRRQLDSRKVRYFGIDPLPLENTSGFFFAQALAEFIPFQDGAFSDVVVMSALDHFFDVDAFFDEVIRVLQPDGRLHIVQSVHDAGGPIATIKVLSHWIKDYLENSATRSKNTAAPKHMTEFSKSTIYQAVSRRFAVIGEATYSKRWYSPSKLFLTMSVLADHVQDRARDSVRRSSKAVEYSGPSRTA